MTTQAVITPIGRVRATTIMVTKVTTKMPFRIGRPVTAASAMLVAQAATAMSQRALSCAPVHTHENHEQGNGRDERK